MSKRWEEKHQGWPRCSRNRWTTDWSSKNVQVCDAVFERTAAVNVNIQCIIAILLTVNTAPLSKKQIYLLNILIYICMVITLFFMWVSLLKNPLKFLFWPTNSTYIYFNRFFLKKKNVLHNVLSQLCAPKAFRRAHGTDVEGSVSGVTWAELPQFITTLAVTAGSCPGVLRAVATQAKWLLTVEAEWVCLVMGRIFASVMIDDATGFVAYLQLLKTAAS